MLILYVAKHGPNDNQDEQAIAYALRKLGHDVVCIEERDAPRDLQRQMFKDVDFILFHHCDRQLESILNHHCPKVFWTFDMIDSPDPTLRTRMLNRQAWMARCVPKVLMGFCTDGDWVAKDTTGKLVHLMQGADERFVGYGEPKYEMPPILFTGMINHGQSRAEHIEQLQERYGDQFSILGANGPKGRKHGRDLADVFASVKIVIAPDGPNTNLYWSNRVYLTLGLGGLLLHPYCQKLTEHYPSATLQMYSNRDELNFWIDKYLECPAIAELLRQNGHLHTLENHLYCHRCMSLIAEVEKQL